MAEERAEQVLVGLVAIPDAVIATLSGIYDVLNALSMLRGQEGIPDRPPFRVEVLGETAEPVRLASGMTLPTHRAAPDAPSDIVIVPSVLLRDGAWAKGRFPALTAWLAARHQAGATICSACSGIFLIAETGLFDGQDATVDWPYARAFAALYPAVRAGPSGRWSSPARAASW